jgi:AcrR family transcriptional regulator
MKSAKKESLAAREPRQERSRYKVQLILEATQRLLEKGGLDALTTNAVAASAGVSIGTLYQFFPNKEAILDTLAERETAEMSARVMAVMEDATIASPEERIGAVVRVVAASYGWRHGAHRLVMAHSLARGSNRLAPLLSRMTAHLAGERQVGPIRRALGHADAFVLAHAFGGVLRAMTAEIDDAPSQEDIAQALTKLVVRFIA